MIMPLSTRYLAFEALTGVLMQRLDFKGRESCRWGNQARCVSYTPVQGPKSNHNEVEFKKVTVLFSLQSRGSRWLRAWNVPMNLDCEARLVDNRLYMEAAKSRSIASTLAMKAAVSTSEGALDSILSEHRLSFWRKLN